MFRFKTGIGRAVMTALAVSATLVAASTSAAAAGHTRVNSQSQTSAGYEIAVAPTSATIEFKLPALTCTATDAGMVAELVFTNFTTSEFTSGGAYANCTGGQAGYAALAEINDHFSYLTPTMSSGDRIKVTVTVSATKTTVTISDTTTHGTVKDTLSGPGGGGHFTGVSIGEVKIGSPNLPVPQFTTLSYSNIAINGASLGTYSNKTAVDMYNGSTLQVVTGSVTGTGTGFTTTFNHT